MTYRAGQRVVCIDAVGAPPLELNRVYTVKDVKGPITGRWRGEIVSCIVLHLHEAIHDPGFCGFHISRFRPVVERPTDISEFTKMLTPKTKPKKRELLTEGNGWYDSPDGTFKTRWKSRE